MVLAQDPRGPKRANETTSEIAYNNIYGLIIGVSNYKYLPKLDYAHKDAKLMAQVLEESFPEANHEITVLTEKKATELSISNGLEELNKKAKKGDLVIFYFAGHGDLAFIAEDSINKRGYYLTASANDSRGYEAGGAIRFDDVNSAIMNITNNGAKVYLIADACRSGKIIDAEGASLTLNALNTSYERTTKFISCQADQLSYEFDHLGHGVFTYYLVKQIDEANSDGSNQEVIMWKFNRALQDSVYQATEFKQFPSVQGAKPNSPIFNYVANTERFFNAIKVGKGDKEVRSANTDIKGADAATKFKNALINGELRGTSNSAYQLLKRAKLQNLSNEEVKTMENMLANELIEKANQNMNRFLHGRAQLNNTIDFQQSEDDLKLAAEILGSNHRMFTSITQRAQFFEAMKLLEKGDKKDFERIEQKLLKLANDEPRATYVFQGLALLYIAKNDKEKAEEQIKISRERINTWTQPINTAAKLNLMANELDKAMQNLELSESLSEDPSEVYLMRGELYFANRQLMDAQKTLESVNKSSYYKDSEEKALVLGKIEELRGRLSKAQAIYQEELKNDEVSPELLMKLGDLSLKQGDTIKSLGYFNNILQFDPNNISAKNAIAIINGGKIDQNINFYKIDEVVALLDELYASKDIDRGLEVVNKALNVNDWTPEYHFQKGKFLYEKGDKSGAEKALRKALTLSPYSFESIRALAIILLEQKKLKQAERLINDYEKYFDRSAKWLSFKYKCFYQMNNKRDLFPILEKAIAFDSLDLEPRRELVLLHVEQNYFEFALKEHKELMKVGGTEKDEDRILLYIERQVNKEYQKRNYLPLTEGLDFLIKTYPTNENYTFMGAMVAYMNKNYKKAEKLLIGLKRNLQMYSRGFQMEVIRLRGKVYLETKRYKEAESAFLTYNRAMVDKDFLGLAMVQFELGKKKAWQENWKRQSEFIDYNEDAYVRYQKMMKKVR
jgi:uncharacterized caspase-like protein/Flp pilus assembly protein TadD